MAHRYYTTLTGRYAPGDLLVGRCEPHPPAKGLVIYLTSDPTPHETIVRRWIEDPAAPGWIYRVVPQGRVWVGREHREAMANTVLVAECLGRVIDRIRPGARGSRLRLRRAGQQDVPVDRRQALQFLQAVMDRPLGVLDPARRRLYEKAGVLARLVAACRRETP